MVTRADELEEWVQKARDAYYNGQPIAPDEVYDARIDELAELRAGSPAVRAVGAPATSAWPKHQHTIPMGSLEKVNTLDEMTRWISAKSRQGVIEELLVTEKMDGASVAVRYEAGKLVLGATRGDGIEGENVTPNVARMQGVPTELSKPLTLDLRGEIVLHKDDLLKHFPDKANTRNTASGTTRRLDGKGCEHLRVYFYQVVEGLEFRTELEQFELLKEHGFLVPNYYHSKLQPGVRTPHDLWAEYQQRVRDELPYEIDGLVVRLNDLTHQISLGEQDGKPLGQVAFKFSAVTRESTVRDIQWQVGGTGRITPVVVFDPVQLVGAKVTNASAYNLRYLLDLNISVGAKILVARANDVIPRVVSVTKQAHGDDLWAKARSGDLTTLRTLVKYPDTCPCCGAQTENQGEYLVCPNRGACSAQAVGRIEQWLKSIGVLGIGESLITQLVKAGLVKTPADLYRLTIQNLKDLEGMGDVSAQNVLSALGKHTELPLGQFLGALSIPLCQSSTIEAVMSAGFDTLESIRGASLEAFQGVPGLGPVKAESLHKWLRTHGALLDDLLSVVRIKAKIHGVLTGKSICFTGKSRLKRAELEGLAKNAGASVKNSVSRDLTFLVMADADSTSTKAQAARKNGTTCLSEDDFLKQVGYSD
jgi:DNA ligase (NAD+)